MLFLSERADFQTEVHPWPGMFNDPPPERNPHVTSSADQIHLPALLTPCCAPLPEELGQSQSSENSCRRARIRCKSHSWTRPKAPTPASWAPSGENWIAW